MKDNTIDFFFALVRAGLWEEGNLDIQVGESMKWNYIYQLAREQSAQGIVLQGIDWYKNHNVNANPNANSTNGAECCINNLKIPQGLLLQWIGEVQMIEQRNKEMNAFINQLINDLRKANVYALLVKGQGIAQCYDKPLWRISGDVDIFLSNLNYEKAKNFLLPFASSVETEGLYGQHLGMAIDQWIVELHGSMRCGLSARLDHMLDEVQNNVFGGGAVRSWMNGKTEVFLPAPDNDVFFVFTHFLKHFYKEGIGLRQICDWCRLIWTYRDSLNHVLLESWIRKAGLMSEWKAFGAFAVTYLGMPIEAMPLLNANDNLKLKKKAKRICDFIMSVGNMGHNRDMSHFSKYPYIVRKCVSMGRRIGDLINHARIFPLDSLRFFPRIMFNGMRSAVRGE